MQMEAKLAEYRARKRKEAMMSVAKELLSNPLGNKKHEKALTSPGTIPIENFTSTLPLVRNVQVLEFRWLFLIVASFVLWHQEDARSEASQVSDSAESLLSDSTIEAIPKHLTWFTVITYCLYLTLWGTVYFIAIHYEFGTVYLIVSALYGIWINTRTGPKKKGEVSAYSVFNPNCEAIDGTLNAEQFEREIRYGPSSVR